MLSPVRSSSKLLRQALTVGGPRQSGLIATRRFQARGIQSVAQTDRVAFSHNFFASYDADARL